MADQDGAATQANTDAAAQAAQDKTVADAAAAAANTDKPNAPAAGDKPAAAASATPASKESKPADKPGAPDKYELKIPDGSRIDQAHVDKIVAHAKAQGLSQEAAQSLLNRDSEVLADHSKGQLEQLKVQSEAWKQEFLTDKETGGDKGVENSELAHRALAEWAPPEFVEELEKTGLGNHPGLMKTFLRIGKAMSDGRIIRSKTPGGSGSKKSAEEILYPNNV